MRWITYADVAPGDLVQVDGRDLKVTATVRHTGARNTVRLICVSATGRELHDTDDPDTKLLLLEREP